MIEIAAVDHIGIRVRDLERAMTFYKYPGYTHVARRVTSIKSTLEALRAHNVRITQGPVSFGRDGHVSVFVRDPDLNVIELRGRNEDLSSIGGVVEYVPEN